MKLFSQLILNLRKVLPYLFVIFVYFSIINLEAQREKRSSTNINNEDIDLENKNKNIKKEKELFQNESRRISIPVYPYKRVR